MLARPREQNNQNTTAQNAELSKMAPNEFLEKQHVNDYLKEAISMMLENRPENPIEFLADHFRTLKQQSMPQPPPQTVQPAGAGQTLTTIQDSNFVTNSNIFKAYRLILLNKIDCKSFDDNVFHAYTLIEKDRGSNVKGFDFIKLVKMLTVEYPIDVVNGIIQQLYRREEENVEFEEFLSGIKTVMLYDNYFEEMEGIFKHLDLHKKGMVNKDEIMEAVRKLRDPSIAETHEMRVPEADDLDIILSDKGSLINYDEFLTAVYKCTLENYGE